VPPGDTTLTINLMNCLPEATSLVVPGQPFTASPARNADNRVRSMTPEAAENGGTSSYTFTGLKPGTFLYQSGSHPAVQVQMGLYGALTKDESTGNAYAGVAYAHEAVLLYSEIDPSLHEAVSTGTYGTDAGPTSTVDYRPSFFLVNGQSYTTDSVATIAAGTANEVTLLRILNAGLRSHAPVLENGRLSIVAEDGNKLPYAKDQATVLLAAGKTHDAVWTPAATGLYSLYDRMLGLNAPGQGSAGMLAKLSVGTTNAPASSVSANNDNFSTGQGVELVVAPIGVLGNDAGGPTAAAVVSSPAHGTLSSWPGNGGFTYTPDPSFYGVDSFTYVASLESNISQPATVGIAVQQAQLPPTALAQQVGVNAT
jgi:FtsP/CotA-like multicopper oxidase with cupredoxin domain